MVTIDVIRMMYLLPWSRYSAMTAPVIEHLTHIERERCRPEVIHRILLRRNVLFLVSADDDNGQTI